MRFTSKAKRALVVVAASLTLVSTSACAAEYRAPEGNCSPSYNPQSQYGNFSAQQAGPRTEHSMGRLSQPQHQSDPFHR